LKASVAQAKKNRDTKGTTAKKPAKKAASS